MKIADDDDDRILKTGRFRRDEGLTFCLGLAGRNKFSMSHHLDLLAFGRGCWRDEMGSFLLELTRHVIDKLYSLTYFYLEAIWSDVPRGDDHVNVPRSDVDNIPRSDFALTALSQSSHLSISNEPPANSTKKAAEMTTYIPSLTLPSQVFAQPALSILLPVGVGLGLGYFVTRTILPDHHLNS